MPITRYEPWSLLHQLHKNWTEPAKVRMATDRLPRPSGPLPSISRKKLINSYCRLISPA